jgi:hypothetical protein
MKADLKLAAWFCNQGVDRLFAYSAQPRIRDAITNNTLVLESLTCPQLKINSLGYVERYESLVNYIHPETREMWQKRVVYKQNTKTYSVNILP